MILSVWTTPANPSGVSWHDLQNSMQQIREVEDACRIDICWGDDVPASLDCYRNSPLRLDSLFLEAADQLEQILTAYPEGFFQRLSNQSPLCFCLAGDIEGNDPQMIQSPGAYVCEEDGISYLVLNCRYYDDWDYIVNHELAHLIDSTLEYRCLTQTDTFFSEGSWDLLNPDGFFYQLSYEDYEANAFYPLWSDYFVDAYGTTFATEDRAQIFGSAMEAYLKQTDEFGYFEKDQPLWNKMKWYAEAIRDGMGYQNTTEELPWEWVLGKNTK